MLYDILHIYDCCGLKTVKIFHFIQSTLYAAFSDFHTVKRNHQSDDRHICGTFYLRNRFFHGFAGSSNVFDHDHTVTVF